MKRGIAFLLVILLPFFSNIYAQKPAKKFIITGKVTDINGSPVSGAVVLIDNKSTEVVTDAEGIFKIKVKNDAANIAVFKPMGGLVEEKINGRTVINFRLSGGTSPQTSDKQATSDNEKVNIGYGYAAKKDLSTNVKTINSKNKKSASYSNIYEMIQSSDPSVQVNGTKITIRGINSINSTDPLLIVDGNIVSSIDDISPQNVESIEILKSADAAIYGSRGANGVIMITLTGKK
jgi:TonB-dependent SusC/RagA subfamily outer membrane receptor